MSFERDFYEERRRKWRRSAFWRGVLATLGVFALLVGFGYWFSDGPRLGSHIAQVEISGVIYDDPVLDAALKSVEENDAAKALIVLINSPGGTTAGSEAVYERLRRIAKDKPVIAVMREVAASGGYIAALGADHIIARGNTITGSVGVIMEYPDVTGLLDRIGVSMETIRSSDLKAEASPYRKLSPEGRAAEQALIDDSYDWFRNLVQTRRGLSGNQLDAATDGRVFTGRVALEMGLIDSIGGSEFALAHLESLDGFESDLPVDFYPLDYEEGGIWGPLGKFLSQNSVLKRFSAEDGPRLYSLAR
ncbi:MAG: signal peptide peptidase SppA [Rhodobacteraceae bacterium]|nr:signal peptide peptidase SppA [Paracoccaceae bacterium]